MVVVGVRDVLVMIWDQLYTNPTIVRFGVLHVWPVNGVFLFFDGEEMVDKKNHAVRGDDREVHLGRKL